MPALRRTVLVLAAALALTAAPATALAHSGGGAVFAGEAGPYLVQAYDAAPGATAGTDRHTFVVLDGTSRATGVTVTVSARPAGDAPAAAVGPVTAEEDASGHVAALPPPPEGGWLVTVAVEGPRGAGSTAYVAHGIGSGSTSAPAGVKLLVAGFGALILGAAVVMVVVGSRRRSVDEAIEKSLYGEAADPR